MSVARSTEILEGFREPVTGYDGVISTDHAYIHAALGFEAIIIKTAQATAFSVGFTSSIRFR